MIRLAPGNPAGGFHAVILTARGEEAATQAWMLASAEIHTFLKAPEVLRCLTGPPRSEEVRNFLDSDFGACMARDVLGKTPVRRQLESRPVRFLKHFAEIQRRTARGDFQ